MLPQSNSELETLQRRLDWFPRLVMLAAVLLILFRLTGLLVYGPLDATLIWFEFTTVIAIVICVAIAKPMGQRLVNARTLAAQYADRQRRDVEQLLQMTNMLQSARGAGDAYTVLRATAENLLDGFGGGLYVFNNSRDRLEMTICWSWPDESPLSPALSPESCWALKRGKHHLNHEGRGTICCEHHHSHLPVLEIPMLAHGEIQGLLKLTPPDSQDISALKRIEATAEALADAMSLAVSSIRLRETLRHQALRDPLTGLYNRRYMQDALERLSAVADRTRSSLSIIMVDLDHFKKLNDEHGHATGDAVLRDAASALIASLRSSDVACRYGGEELVVLLPDCSLSQATEKAEAMRERIETLSARYDASISASFGVAAIPETHRTPEDALKSADEALYQAKEAGRNRVVAASITGRPASLMAAE
ncbi:GGDEF domain-containing protein [Sphingosinithalassobacter portus]|uniref:GGDEF domain-containing protein n=1 Tax=Stakelama portus TaxID=2676234 RepID=UPI00137AE2BB|nr:GGDEF domain-containing protein [Sphingosinithalassobacter portus]